MTTKAKVTLLSKKEGLAMSRAFKRDMERSKRQLRNKGAKSFECVFIENGKVRSDIDG